MLCRACGNEMDAFEFCPDCNEAIQWKCGSCEKENDKSVHIHIKEEQLRQPSPNSSKTTTAVAFILTATSGLVVPF